MYNVVYLPTADRQLSDAIMYIARELGSPTAAEHLLDEVDRICESLADLPYRYSLYPVTFALKKEVRFVPVMNYILFYTVNEEEKTVEIWRFLHQRQDAGKQQ